jgi:hypothetical protein
MAGFTYVQRSRDSREDQGWVTNRGQRHKPETVREVLADRFGDCQGEPGLADAAGSGEGHEADSGLAEEITDSSDFALPPDKGRGGARTSSGRVAGRNGGGPANALPYLLIPATTVENAPWSGTLGAWSFLSRLAPAHDPA